MTVSLKDGEIEELKSHADIHTIVSGYVNLKKTGKNYSGLCPFHKEKTPSFTVDTRKQLFHCFGCGEGGDVISFIMKIENLDFIEAVELLAKKVNYNLKFTDDKTFKKTEKKSRIYDLNELAVKYYEYILFNSNYAAKAISYLKSRGFNSQTLKNFELGFSPPGWKNFCDYAIKKGFNKKEIIESGLAIQSDKNSDDFYDRFRERIIFPIRDIAGRVVGFGGRILEESKSKNQVSSLRLKSAKYINTPETRIYSKSKNVYGLFYAKKSIVENDQAVIVEGYTDVMALSQCGIYNSVASLGTALTIEQVELIGRFTKNIILLFDSDTAGINASIRGMERLREYNQKLDLFMDSNIDMRVVILEKGLDPAEYIFKKGSADFKNKLKDSVNIIDFIIMMILKKYKIDDLNEKLRAANELVNFIATLSSKIVQEECIKKIAVKLNVAESILIEQLLNRIHKKDKSGYINHKENVKRVDSLQNIPPPKRIEIEALKILINGSGKKFNDIMKIGENHFKFEDTRKLYKIIKETYKSIRDNAKDVNFPIEISSNKLNKESLEKLYNLIVFSPINYSDNDFASEEVYFNLRKIFISDKIENLEQLLKKYENFVKNLNKEAADKEQLLKLKIAENKIRLILSKLNELEIEKRSFA